ncbi:Rieske (2Fe-2S) protein [Methylobacterium nonmethylotrophicum]|uniref:Non-heme iron oxygenase ferredoxin subunit n=1 Tax=Methylobacterium nonmethylotrophicum TaxID=1141884 RepID=A0A4Z0NLT1_9HYPH|nr:non-heme iron oxygenase ferredoxin subunit [Methylobacterium nonmethylotrophicum]TGD96776.1 non-heme iron oxygenase ferredoxin subunit [Methylobacterium nonmethylotrophicum]
MTWHAVAALAEFEDRPVLAREAEGQALALYRLDGAVYATQARCTHAGALLTEGEVVEGYIECPLHYGLFEIATGRAQGGPVCRDLATYPVRVEDGQVWVEIAPVGA